MLVPHFSWEGLCFPGSSLQEFSISLVVVSGAAAATPDSVMGCDGHRARLLSDKSPGCTCHGVHKRVNSDLPLGTKAFCLPCWGRLGSCSHQSCLRNTLVWSRAGIPLAAGRGAVPGVQVQLCCPVPSSAEAKAAPPDGKKYKWREFKPA